MTQQTIPANAGGEKFKVTMPTGEVIEVRKSEEMGRYIPKETPDGVLIVAIKFNNKVASLQRPVDRDGKVDYVELTSRDGAMIYRRSLSFLLIRAIHELFPDLKVYINHSLNHGYYGEVYSQTLGTTGPVPLCESDFDRLKKRMMEIVEADEPFERTEATIEEAKRLFAEAGLSDKVALLSYRDDDLISIYRCGTMINHFYGQLVPSTGYLKTFDLKPCDPGFVLVAPRRQHPDQLPVYRHEPKLFSVYQEYENWMRILGVRTVAHLNTVIDSRDINEYVLIAEALHEKKIGQLADRIAEHPRNPRVILLAGPSASGKTTTVKRLNVQLRVNGLRPIVIGLDDFFVERERTPKDESGAFDFEHFNAIDVPLLQDCIRRLLQGEEVRLPRFDFISGRPVPGDTVKLEPGQPMVLEGIHALNPNLLPEIPDGMKFKIYISPLTHLNIDDHNRISSSDARLIRRMVRDASYRGYKASATLDRWPSVRRGEERNIFPYQGHADFIFNSALPYEVCVLKHHAMKALEEVPREHPSFSEAARLIKFMSYFREIKESLVPRHSLLREFIGGSSFKY